MCTRSKVLFTQNINFQFAVHFIQAEQCLLITGVPTWNQKQPVGPIQLPEWSHLAQQREQQAVTCAKALPHPLTYIYSTETVPIGNMLCSMDLEWTIGNSLFTNTLVIGFYICNNKIRPSCSNIVTSTQFTIEMGERVLEISCPQK